MEEVIRIEKLEIGYRDAVVARDISLVLPKGKVTALIGANGAGKSTLISAVTGSHKFNKGDIYVAGKDLRRLGRKDLSRLLAVVTTEPDMAGGLRVEELIALGRSPYTGISGRLREADRLAVEKAMESVGIVHKRGCFIGQLSDGERQKAMIARGLAQDTPILIMDEPFSFLDVAARIEILLLLKKIAREEGKTILFSTHEVTQALRMVDNLWMFHNGKGDKRVSSGSPDELIGKGLVDGLFESEAVIFSPELKDFVVRKS